ncbi:hypothetical protein NBRC116493_30310 [Aurantivibrio infirmus]
MNIPLDKWSGAEATKELHESISQFNEASGKQTKQMLVLTYVITALTFVMLIGLGIQIYLAL